jgi:hypothetical protein
MGSGGRYRVNGEAGRPHHLHAIRKPASAQWEWAEVTLAELVFNFLSFVFGADPRVEGNRLEVLAHQLLTTYSNEISRRRKELNEIRPLDIGKNPSNWRFSRNWLVSTSHRTQGMLGKES